MIRKSIADFYRRQRKGLHKHSILPFGSLRFNSVAAFH
nr:MAG TPA: hypothetical protein [Caudoviricetes sp.]DAP71048.1 MAG TPA: hypothetical protein [Bacteriophage sp.]